MKRQFLAAALACNLWHISGPGKPGWLIKCADDKKTEYLHEYPKRKHTAIRQAKSWLRLHRPRQFTVSVQELGK